jgi:PTS system galactitol-specific IIC component
MAIGLYFVTWMSGDFTMAANHVAQVHPDDKTVQVPAGFQAGALDFASSPLSTAIYACMKYLKWIGAGILVVCTMALVIWNRIRINKK